jgi:hypothetical protein
MYVSIFLIVKIRIFIISYTFLTDGAKKRTTEVINNPVAHAIKRPNEPIYVRAKPPRNTEKGINP